ncbi:MAG: type II toxin-antitoxin system YafQ family toxin [Muribaculaceae bacterium]
MKKLKPSSQYKKDYKRFRNNPQPGLGAGVVFYWGGL